MSDSFGVRSVQLPAPSLGLRGDLVFLATSVQGAGGDWVVCGAVSGDGRTAVAWYRSDEDVDARRRGAYMYAVRLAFRLAPATGGVRLATDVPWLASDLNTIIGAASAGQVPPLTGDRRDQVAEFIRARGATVLDIPERGPDTLGHHPGIQRARALAIAVRSLLADGDDPAQHPDLLALVAERRIRSPARLDRAYHQWRTQRAARQEARRPDPQQVTTARFRLPLDGKATVVACASSSQGAKGTSGACAAVSGDGIAEISWWRPDIGSPRTRLWAARLGLRLATEIGADTLIIDDGDARIVGELKAIRTARTDGTRLMRHSQDVQAAADIADLLAERRIDIHARAQDARLLRVVCCLAWSVHHMVLDGLDPLAHEAALIRLALTPPDERTEKPSAYPSWKAAYLAWQPSAEIDPSASTAADD